MSGAKYSNYILEEQKKKRLEEKRKRLLEEERRRQEEIRRKERERRRLKEIEAEKERIQVLRHFREVAFSLSKKPAPSQSNVKFKSRELPLDRTKKQTAEMKELIQLMKEHLEAIPTEWNKLFSPEVRKIQQILQQVEDSNHDPFYYQKLKWAHRDLGNLILEASQKMEQINNQASEARENIDDLVVQLQVVKAKSMLEKQSKTASDMIKTLENLSRENNPDKILSLLPDLCKKVQKLYLQFEKTLARDQERRQVLESTHEVLAELGYQVLNLEHPAGVEKNSTGVIPLFLHYRTPEKAMVRLAFGLDNSMYSEFIRLKNDEDPWDLKTVDKNVMVYRCEQWCRDYDLLVNKLSAKKIHFRENWRKSSASENHRVMEVSQQYIEKFEKTISLKSIEIKERE